ncbi:MAG TPA: hypothetical protein VFO34_12215 [Candidatus Acidoferrales bacterium]|nr:hypothetical protein [Candidatus Acidoferrales bacterium]
MSGNMKKVGRSLLATATLGGFLLIGGVPALHAANRCERRVRNDEISLNKAVRRHGENSRQADRWRNQLRIDRDTCRY